MCHLWSNSGQRDQLFEISGDLSAVLVIDDFGGFLDVLCLFVVETDF
jgi:hypothetical protein